MLTIMTTLLMDLKLCLAGGVPGKLFYRKSSNPLRNRTDSIRIMSRNQDLVQCFALNAPVKFKPLYVTPLPRERTGNIKKKTARRISKPETETMLRLN